MTGRWLDDYNHPRQYTLHSTGNAVLTILLLAPTILSCSCSIIKLFQQQNKWSWLLEVKRKCIKMKTKRHAGKCTAHVQQPAASIWLCTHWHMLQYYYVHIVVECWIYRFYISTFNNDIIERVKCMSMHGCIYISISFCWIMFPLRSVFYVNGCRPITSPTD